MSAYMVASIEEFTPVACLGQRDAMNPNHPHGQMLSYTHYMQMPHVSAWLSQAVRPISGFNAQVPTVMPLEGYKTSPPQTPMTNNMNVYRGAFRGGGAAV